MKKVIGKVRLCPNTPAWSNMENNIFLSKARRKEMDIHEGCDMNVIMKAVESGLIEFKEVKQQQQPAAKQVKNKKDVVQEAKKKAAAKAKKEEVKVDVNVTNEGAKPEDKPEDKPQE